MPIYWKGKGKISEREYKRLTQEAISRKRRRRTKDVEVTKKEEVIMRGEEPKTAEQKIAEKRVTTTEAAIKKAYRTKTPVYIQETGLLISPTSKTPITWTYQPSKVVKQRWAQEILEAPQPSKEYEYKSVKDVKRALQPPSLKKQVEYEQVVKEAKAGETRFFEGYKIGEEIYPSVLFYKGKGYTTKFPAETIKGLERAEMPRYKRKALEFAEDIKESWTKSNIWLAEKTTYKFMPSLEEKWEKELIRAEKIKSFAEEHPFISSLPLISISKLYTKYDWKKLRTDKEYFKEFREGSQLIGYGESIYEFKRERPLTILTLTGAGFAVGFGGTALTSLGSGWSTTMSLAGKGLLGVYGYTEYKKYKTAETPYKKGYGLGKTTITIGSLGLGAFAGAKTALRAGFIPQPSYEPKLTYETFKVRTLGKEPKELTLYRGIGWKQPATGRGGALVGWGKGRPHIGTPKLTLKGISDVDVISLSTPTHRRIVGDLLKRYGGTRETAMQLPSTKENLIIKQIAGDEYAKWQKIMDVTKYTYKVKPLKYTDVFMRDVKTYRTKEGFGYTVETFAGEKTFIGKRASIGYGSWSAKPQMSYTYRVQMGKSGDIDVFLIKSEPYGEWFAKTHAFDLRSFGEKSFVTTKEPLLIQQSFGKTAHHMVDIHTLESSMASYQKAPESFFGYPFSQRTIKIEGLHSMPLSESGIRMASSITIPRIRGGYVYLAPETHRLKDILRFFPIQQELTTQVGMSKTQLKSLKDLYPSGIFKTDLSGTWGSGYALPTYKSVPITPVVDFEVVFPKKPSVSIKKISPSFIAPSPSLKISPSIPVSVSPSVSPSRISPSPSVSPSVSLSPSPSLSPSISPSRSISPSPSPSPSISPSPSYSPSLSPSPSFSPSPSPSPSYSPSPSISPYPSIMPPPPFKINLEIGRLPSKEFPAYKVFIKRFGEFKPLKGVYTKREALLKGAWRTHRTLAATFKIKPTGGMAVRKRISEFPSFKQQFRPYRKKKGKRIGMERTFIERRKFRLSAPTEVKEIQWFKKSKGFF